MKIPRLIRHAQRVWTQLNERLLNISTMDPTQWSEAPGRWRGPRTDRSVHSDNHAYRTPDYYYIRRLIRALHLRPDDVIYDIGSGMGRIVCMLSRERVKKVVGLELLPELCDISRANAANLRGRRSPIEIRCGDASTADIADGTIYFLYNPFGRETLMDFLQNLETSLVKNPRMLRLVYYNSNYGELIEKLSWIERYHGFETWNGQPVQFYRSTSAH
jgi:histone methylation protein DOT1